MCHKTRHHPALRIAPNRSMIYVHTRILTVTLQRGYVHKSFIRFPVAGEKSVTLCLTISH